MPTTPRNRSLIRPVFAACIALVLVLAGCSSGDDEPTTTAAADGPEVAGEITVSAAASLTEAFTAIGEEFEAANPGTDLTFNFGSSVALATQIVEGAPTDVAAFADVMPMDTLAGRELLVKAPEVFARNQLVIVTPPDDTGGVESLADLADAGTVALCVDTAPCGRFADQLLADAGVELPADRVTRGQDVKATLTAVTEGDADAAIVYVTDAEAAGERVDTVEIPEAADLVADYPIAALSTSGNVELAEAFVAFVLAPGGRAVLEEAGFLAP